MRKTITSQPWAHTLCLVMAASVTAAGAVEAHAGQSLRPIVGKSLVKGHDKKASVLPVGSSAQPAPTGNIHAGNVRDFLLQLRTGAAMNTAELRKIATAAGVRVTLTRRLLGNEYTLRLTPGVASTDINTMVGRLESDSNILSAEALTPNSGVINGQLRTLRLSSDPGQVYSIYVPKKGGLNAPILVAIGNFTSHLVGPSGDGAALAEKYGAVVIMPQFTTNRFANYGRLDPFDRAGAADVMLGRIVAEAGKMAGAKTDKLYLLGYGTGGEFAHRYAMAHPDLTASVVTVNAASFTMPDPTKNYPAGISPASLPPQMTMDPSRFLKVPALAMAISLPAAVQQPRPATPGYSSPYGYANLSPYFQAFPGLTQPGKHGALVPPGLLWKSAVTPRVNVLAQRAQAWINAMSTAAKAQNLATSYGFKLISYCPGSNCIGHDGVSAAFAFLFNGKLPATPTPPVGHTLTVSAGASQTVNAGSPVTLQGTIQQAGAPSAILVNQWIQIGGPTVVLSGADTPTATFTAPMATTTTPVSSSLLVLTFKYTVIDNLGYTRAAITHVTVKPAAPTVGTPVPTGGTHDSSGGTTSTSGGTASPTGGATNPAGGSSNTSGSSGNISGGSGSTSGNPPVQTGTVVQGGNPSTLPIGAR